MAGEVALGFVEGDGGEFAGVDVFDENIAVEAAIFEMFSARWGAGGVGGVVVERVVVGLEGRLEIAVGIAAGGAVIDAVVDRVLHGAGVPDPAYMRIAEAIADGGHGLREEHVFLIEIDGDLRVAREFFISTDAVAAGRVRGLHGVDGVVNMRDRI